MKQACRCGGFILHSPQIQACSNVKHKNSFFEPHFTLYLKLNLVNTRFYQLTQDFLFPSVYMGWHLCVLELGGGRDLICDHLLLEFSVSGHQLTYSTGNLRAPSGALVLLG